MNEEDKDQSEYDFKPQCQSQSITLQSINKRAEAEEGLIEEESELKISENNEQANHSKKVKEDDDMKVY